MRRIFEEVGADSIEVAYKPSSMNTVVYTNSYTPDRFEGLRTMEIQEKFKEMLQDMETVRSLATKSLEVQEIISQEQDRISREAPENTQEYGALIDMKERFQYINQAISTLDMEIIQLAGEILTDMPEDVEEEEEETEEEETEEEETEEAEEESDDVVDELEDALEKEEVEESRRRRRRKITESVIEWLKDADLDIFIDEEESEVESFHAGETDDVEIIPGSDASRVDLQFGNGDMILGVPKSLFKVIEESKKPEGDTKLLEKAMSKHVKQCAGEINPKKMSDKEISAAIQGYYDDNEVGGNFSSFKKAVMNELKSKKESVQRFKIRRIAESKKVTEGKNLNEGDLKDITLNLLYRLGLMGQKLTKENNPDVYEAVIRAIKQKAGDRGYKAAWKDYTAYRMGGSSHRWAGDSRGIGAAVIKELGLEEDLFNHNLPPSTYNELEGRYTRFAERVWKDLMKEEASSSTDYDRTKRGTVESKKVTEGIGDTFKSVLNKLGLMSEPLTRERNPEVFAAMDKVISDSPFSESDKLKFKFGGDFLFGLRASQMINELGLRDAPDDVISRLEKKYTALIRSEFDKFVKDIENRREAEYQKKSQEVAYESKKVTEGKDLNEGSLKDTALTLLYRLGILGTKLTPERNPEVYEAAVKALENWVGGSTYRNAWAEYTQAPSGPAPSDRWDDRFPSLGDKTLEILGLEDLDGDVRTRLSSKYTRFAEQIWKKRIKQEKNQSKDVLKQKSEETGIAYESKKVTEGKDLTKHIKQCADSIDPEKMSIPEMSDIIQGYYEDNEVGGSYSQFRKEVLQSLKK